MSVLCLPSRPRSRALLASAACLCFAAGPAHAFPIAEGAGAISSMAGVVVSLLAASVPKGSMSAGAHRTLHLAIIACLALFVLSLSALWGLDRAVMRANRFEEISRQSRPELELEGDIAPSQETKLPTAAQVAILNSPGVLVPISQFRTGQTGAGAKLAFLDDEPDLRQHRPIRTARVFRKDDRSSLASFIAENSGNVILVSKDPGLLAEMIEAFRRDGFADVRGIWLGDPDLSRSPDAPLPTIDESEDIFELTLIDIRDADSVRETHTLINARVIPLLDWQLMRDAEIRRFFDTHGHVVFVSYAEEGYLALHARLERLVPGRYAFVGGGLKKHYLQQGRGLTPSYFNMRWVDPIKLMEVYAARADLRFLCVPGASCPANLPEENVIHMRDFGLDKTEMKKAIAALPKDALYVTVSGSQESYGNAILAGYLLVGSGHSYLGDLAMAERFSLEEIRQWVKEKVPRKISLSAYREAIWVPLAIRNILARSVQDLGWFAAFVLAGFGLRLLLSPFQIMVFKSYYRAHPSALGSLVGSIVILGALVGAYGFLNDAISYYAVVDHSIMQRLLTDPGNVQFIAPVFVALVVAQAWLSFPYRKSIAIFVTLLIGAIYLAGWVDAMSPPVLVFLLGSEIASLTLQLPFGLSFLREARNNRQGIFSRRIARAGEEDGVPAKWGLCMDVLERHPRYEPKSGRGVLVKIETTAGRQAGVAFAGKLNARDLIVRSASGDDEEERLGGLHHSFEVDNEPEQIVDALENLAKAGCSHAWVQARVSSNCFGILSSVGPDGKRGVGLEGPAGVATEASAQARSFSVHDRGRREMGKMLRRVEGVIGGPVIIEYAAHPDGKIDVLQVRRMERSDYPEVVFFPRDIADFVIAEDFVTRPSRISGELIERATAGYYVFCRGFLYRRKEASVRRLIPHEGRKTGDRLEASLLSCLTEIRIDREASQLIGPGRLAAYSHAVLLAYRDIFRMSQSVSFGAKRTVLTGLSREIISASGNELDVMGQPRVDLEGYGRAVPGPLDRREYLHLLLVVATCLLREVVDLSGLSEGDMHNLGFEDLTGSERRQAGIQGWRDEVPLTAGATQSEIVPGKIHGKVWDGDRTDLPAGDGPWVLVAEEISSRWVKDLHLFAGIAATYGHANAHLGISARAMEIPFRKIEKAQVDVALSSGRIDLP